MIGKVTRWVCAAAVVSALFQAQTVSAADVDPAATPTADLAPCEDLAEDLRAIGGRRGSVTLSVHSLERAADLGISLSKSRVVPNDEPIPADWEEWRRHLRPDFQERYADGLGLHIAAIGGRDPAYVVWQVTGKMYGVDFVLVLRPNGAFPPTIFYPDLEGARGFICCDDEIQVVEISGQFYIAEIRGPDLRLPWYRGYLRPPPERAPEEAIYLHLLDNQKAASASCRVSVVYDREFRPGSVEVMTAKLDATYETFWSLEALQKYAQMTAQLQGGVLAYARLVRETGILSKGRYWPPDSVRQFERMAERLKNDIPAIASQFLRAGTVEVRSDLASEKNVNAMLGLYFEYFPEGRSSVIEFDGNGLKKHKPSVDGRGVPKLIEPGFLDGHDFFATPGTLRGVEGETRLFSFRFEDAEFVGQIGVGNIAHDPAHPGFIMNVYKIVDGEPLDAAGFVIDGLLQTREIRVGPGD